MQERHEVHNHYFINNVFSSLFKGIADWFKTEWFPRSTDMVISTYSKAVQHWQKKKLEGGEGFTFQYPLISIDVNMDFEPDPQSGRFFHGYPLYATKFATRLWLPDIYNDGELIVTPGWNRYKGSLEINLFCSSVYELIDNRILAFQFWGGLDRTTYPTNITGYIIIPDEIVSYSSVNPWTEVTKTINWDNNLSDVYLVRNINQNKMCYPFIVRPYLKLVGINDSTDKYGGSGDTISENRMTITVEWECYLPTHIIILERDAPDYCNEGFRGTLDLTVDMKYTPLRPPMSSYDDDVYEVGVPDKIFHIVTLEGDNEGVFTYDLSLDKSFSYSITEMDISNLNSGGNIILNMIDETPNCNQIKIFYKNGELIMDYDWKVIDPYTILIHGFRVEDFVEANDVILVNYYDAKVVKTEGD